MSKVHIELDATYAIQTDPYNFALAKARTKQGKKVWQQIKWYPTIRQAAAGYAEAVSYDADASNLEELGRIADRIDEATERLQNAAQDYYLTA